MRNWHFFIILSFHHKIVNWYPSSSVSECSPWWALWETRGMFQKVPDCSDPPSCPGPAGGTRLWSLLVDTLQASCWEATLPPPWARNCSCVQHKWGVKDGAITCWWFMHLLQWFKWYWEPTQTKNSTLNLSGHCADLWPSVWQKPL